MAYLFPKIFCCLINLTFRFWKQSFVVLRNSVTQKFNCFFFTLPNLHLSVQANKPVAIPPKKTCIQESGWACPTSNSSHQYIIYFLKFFHQFWPWFVATKTLSQFFIEVYVFRETLYKSMYDTYCTLKVYVISKM